MHGTHGTAPCRGPLRRQLITGVALREDPGLATDTKLVSRHGPHTPRAGNSNRRPGPRSSKLPTSLNARASDARSVPDRFKNAHHLLIKSATFAPRSSSQHPGPGPAVIDHGSKSYVRHAPPVAWQTSETRLIASAPPPGRTRQATTKHAGAAPDETVRRGRLHQHGRQTRTLRQRHGREQLHRRSPDPARQQQGRHCRRQSHDHGTVRRPDAAGQHAPWMQRAARLRPGLGFCLVAGLGVLGRPAVEAGGTPARAHPGLVKAGPLGAPLTSGTS